MTNVNKKIRNATKVKSNKVNEKVYRMNFAQIYPEDRGINFAVKESKKILKQFE